MNLPMLHVDVETDQLAVLLSKIGGFWKVISALAFLLFSFLMFDRMMQLQAKKIAKRKN